MSLSARRDVYQAIADPTRRDIISLLAGDLLNLNEISDHFKISRQAVSLHVKILEECRIISIQKKGRERICSLEFQELSEVHNWTSQFESLWRSKLKALDRVVEENSKASTNKPT